MRLPSIVKRGLFAACAFGIAYLFVGQLFRSPAIQPVQQPDPMPLILQQVRALGELHTAEFAYQNVFEYQTARDPQEWVARIPGGTSLVRGATTNKALVSATGTVQAGIDLSQARVVRDDGGLLVVLPEPTIYEPNVDAKVHRSRGGLLWDDANIGLKAQDDAERRMRSAARKGGILDEARSNAETTIYDLIAGITDSEVRIEFSSAGSA